MEWLGNLFWPDGNLLGIEWNFWKIVGWIGNGVFFSRFLVQWYATEKRKQVVVPTAFWWLSLAGSLLLFAYALFYRRDSVFIFAYAFTWIPYVRNLLIHRRHRLAHITCTACGQASPPAARFCSRCGAPLPADDSRAGQARPRPGMAGRPDGSQVDAGSNSSK
jgi:lipid-A-disaccharide synthase-like uncharacterized protein